MRTRTHGLDEKEMELVKLLMADCKSTGDIQEKLKRLFAGTIEQMLEAELDEHLGYDKNSTLGNNTGNSRNGYGKKTIVSDYGECEIAVPRDRNGEFEPKVIEKRQTRTDEIEQKIMVIVRNLNKFSYRYVPARHRRYTKRNLWLRNFSGHDFKDNRQNFAGSE